MLKTIKSKIMIIIFLALIIFSCCVSLFIYDNLYENLTENIKIDMDNMRRFTVSTLKYSSVVIDDNFKVKSKTVNEVNSNYNCYIGMYSLNNEIFSSKGDLLLEDSVMNILNYSKAKSELIKFNVKDGLTATYVYPVYLSGEYYCSMVIQKSYDDDYKNIKSMLYNIIVAQVMLLIGILLSLNFFVNQIVHPLKQLSIEMKKYGDGKEVRNIKITSEDEVGQVAESFNTMIEEKKKLENISKEFFNNATHELKTPVTSIYGYVQILKEEKIENLDKVFLERACNRISLECCKLRDLVQKLLELSRGEVRKKPVTQTIFLDKTISEICERLSDRARKINKEFIINLKEFKLETVKEDIEQIILNLIDNALKYSIGNKIFINLETDKDKFQITIENEINDIPDSVAKDLLLPFVKYNVFEGKREECISSSGLGLYLCSEIAKKNNLSLSYKINNNKIAFYLNNYESI